MELVTHIGLPPALVERETGKMAKVPMYPATASMDLEVERLMAGFLDDETFNSTSTSGCRSGFYTGNDKINADAGALELEDADLIDELGATLFDDDQAPVFSADQTVTPSVAQAVVESAAAMGVVKDTKRKCDEADASEAFQPVYGYEGGDRAATAEEVRRRETTKYRRTVAIPRYLRKKANRNWSKKAMYESRTKAAQARSRINGKFVVSDNSEPGFYFV